MCLLAEHSVKKKQQKQHNKNSKEREKNTKYTRYTNFHVRHETGVVSSVLFFLFKGRRAWPFVPQRVSRAITTTTMYSETATEWERRRVGTWDMTSALYCYFPNEWELLKDIIAASWSKHTHTYILTHTAATMCSTCCKDKILPFIVVKDKCI